MRPFMAALALGLAASLTACARPGDTPTGTPPATSEVTRWASMAPAPVQSGVLPRFAPLPGTGSVGCDGRRMTPVRPAPPKGSVPPRIRPTSVPAADADAAERARRALEAANPPLPRRGPLPAAAAGQAESCARSLSPELTLLMHSTEPLDEQTLRRVLTRAGLTGVVIAPGLVFAGATGKACVFGSLAGDRPELSIGPPGLDATCRP